MNAVRRARGNEIEMLAVRGEPGIGFDAIASECSRLGNRPAAAGAMTDQNPPTDELFRAAHEIEIGMQRIERAMRFELGTGNIRWCPRRDIVDSRSGRSG